MNNLEPGTSRVLSMQEETKCAQLKEEVTRWPHKYIRGHGKNIAYTLTCQDEMVKCLLAFRTGALQYMVEILAIIEWGMQHRKMEEPFPVPPMPKWLCMPRLTQTTMPPGGSCRSLPQQST